jgi:hypothetical protein
MNKFELIYTNGTTTTMVIIKENSQFTMFIREAILSEYNENQ